MSHARIREIIEHPVWRNQIIGSPSRADAVAKRIEEQLVRAENEGHASVLEDAISRCLDAFRDADSPLREDYLNAIRGDVKVAVRMDRLIHEPHGSDFIELYALSGQNNLKNVLKHCETLAQGTEEQRAAASELLQHVAPIAAKRQPNFMLKYTHLLLDPADGSTALIPSDEASECLSAAAARGSREVVIHYFKSNLAIQNDGITDAHSNADQSRVSIHQANVIKLQSIMATALDFDRFDRDSSQEQVGMQHF